MLTQRTSWCRTKCGSRNGDFAGEEFVRLQSPGGVDCLDKLLIGNSDSGDYSEKWKREFAQRPTWCDADMTLQQIQRGKAYGSKAALYSRSFLQRCLFWLECYIQRKPCFVISSILELFSLSCYVLQYVKIETDIVKLWVVSKLRREIFMLFELRICLKGGRLDAELTYLSNMETKYDEKLANLAQEKPSEGGYQAVVQTVERGDENILTSDGLLRHVDLVSEIAGLAVNVDGFNWTLRDICFKPGGIDPAKMTSDIRDYAPVLEKLMPCVWITPLDCFWEGGKPIGPDPPITSEELRYISYLFNTSHDLPVSWSTFNPQDLVKLFESIADDHMGTLSSSFKMSGIGQGYIDRYCIDPYDPDCPSTAKNGFDFCKYFQKYKKHVLDLTFRSASEAFPVELGLVAYILNTAHDLPVSWSTFKPEEDVKLFKDIADDMGTLASCFETEIRGICDEYQALGIDTFPHGIAFTFWEQYLNLNLNLFNAVGVIMVAVFCVISLLLINPWSASCIMVILILMTVELAGFLGFVGIKLNPVSAVMLITAVGIGVEFTAHVVFAFLTSLGDRNERIAAAIDRLFVPVIHGALSAHLGIVMLAFSEFEFVVKYLFVVMFALIIIGLINGLALLPVLLCLMGPSCD
ncbi:hypothetical protein QR680_001622 [Steinernema hermaphroditum]|uniref:SSD domain-containing protein n=1 Tax=Steinernema hermaphroditum TaxID=289476 RepID=A0AA39LGB1_9BILA|nr:hypothetical protein QR680_001622 [Steinernema hermaphroditum]